MTDGCVYNNIPKLQLSSCPIRAHSRYLANRIYIIHEIKRMEPSTYISEFGSTFVAITGSEVRGLKVRTKGQSESGSGSSRAARDESARASEHSLTGSGVCAKEGTHLSSDSRASAAATAATAAVDAKNGNACPECARKRDTKGR